MALGNLETYLFVTICKVIIYAYVNIRQLEKAVERFSFSAAFNTASKNHSDGALSSSARERAAQQSYERSRRFGAQATLYCVFFVMTWIFATVSSILSNFFRKRIIRWCYKY